MAKKQKPVILEPVKLGILKRTIAHFKRNPYKYIVALATTFVGLPTAAASYNAYIEPLMPAWHSWVRDQIAPILTAQTSQATSIDRFLLYQLQETLSKTQADPAAKSSPVVQERIKDLQDQITATQSRIDKAGK